MKNSYIIVFGEKLELKFLQSWIKYLRTEQNISQKGLAYGICSTSHLCYFENGKRPLQSEDIERILKKLGITNINKISDIGLIRQKLYNLLQAIENQDKDEAEIIYCSISSMKEFIENSLYSMEYKIYSLAYQLFIKNADFEELEPEFKFLDKISDSLEENLKYVYYLTTGRGYYKYSNPDEGIKRLNIAKEIKDTPYISYLLGFSYCFNNDPLRGTFYLTSALTRYENSGKYLNAIWCHNTLSVCYSYLGIYEECRLHLKAALNGAKYFQMNKTMCGIYINLGDSYFSTKDYEKSLYYSSEAMNLCNKYNKEFALLAAANYIDAALKSHNNKLINPIFTKYLTPEYKSSRYYKFLWYKYLTLYKFNDSEYYNHVSKDILPYYKKLNYIELFSDIQLTLIEYLENQHRYKEAAQMYKELIRNGLIINKVHCD